MRAIPAICGPTGSGKTALSLMLASEFDMEIISADSMQIYRYMDIGTAKATADERRAVRHHLIDIVDPDITFSAEAYRERALAAIDDITSRGKLPLIVGGTGLYVDTLMRSPSDAVPASSPEYRDKILSGIRCDDDKEKLWRRLYEVDEPSAEKIHKNNVKRVIRALEIYDTTGKPKSYWDKLSLDAPGLAVKLFVLDFHNRDILYERIDGRVDQMFDMGLEDEVRILLDKGYLRGGDTASSAIGYKELLEYIDGKCTLKLAKDNIKLATRRYAKRQQTWFNHNEGAVHIYMDDGEGLRPISEIYSELSAEILG